MRKVVCRRTGGDDVPLSARWNNMSRFVARLGAAPPMVDEPHEERGGWAAFNGAARSAAWLQDVEPQRPCSHQGCLDDSRRVARHYLGTVAVGATPRCVAGRGAISARAWPRCRCALHPGGEHGFEHSAAPRRHFRDVRREGRPLASARQSMDWPHAPIISSLPAHVGLHQPCGRRRVP